ncbi:unnamed protein product [Camellia sinensis]
MQCRESVKWQTAAKKQVLLTGFGFVRFDQSSLKSLYLLAKSATIELKVKSVQALSGKKICLLDLVNSTLNCV